ncbi:MAG: Uma2 family endonuclease [Thermostichus sp. DG02_5_bins_236]
MTVTTYRWPTQHDLPDTDDTPLDNEDQGRQYPLLRDPLLLHWAERQDFFVACNMGLYYALPRQVIVPDLFLVLGVPRWRDGSARKSYVVWDEGNIFPILVLEIICNDQGEEKPGQVKFQLYERRLRIPYYVTFELETDELNAYQLQGGHYEQLPTSGPEEQALIRLADLDLCIGRWWGSYEGRERFWVRWYDGAGQLLPTGAELERQRAELERQRAELERQRADRERSRAERLAQRLRELGENPEL